jgi:glycosyltransferase involved in cell wall biosynthesis
VNKLKIAFATHLSLSYGAGGEKWIINTAKALAKKHEVEVYALPFLLDGKRKIEPQKQLEDIPYHEGFHHNIKADITYCMYNPLSFLNFNINGPKIAGIHSETYWHKPNLRYGKYPLIANIVNRFTSYVELRRFNAVHRLNSLYPVNHPSVFTIPNYVDSNVYRPIKKSDEFTVAYASRQVWQKGFDIFKKIERHLNCRVKVSGGIAEQNMPGFLSDAHVVVAPSRVDTFGLSLVESMMVGTPVVTSPLPSHFELGLPLKYACSPDDYLGEVNKLKQEPNFGLLSDVCRFSAMRFDKKNVLDKLEAMLCKVANEY